jgi:hypothetical protein
MNAFINPGVSFITLNVTQTQIVLIIYLIFIFELNFITIFLYTD